MSKKKKRNQNHRWNSERFYPGKKSLTFSRVKEIVTYIVSGLLKNDSLNAYFCELLEVYVPIDENGHRRLNQGFLKFDATNFVDFLNNSPEEFGSLPNQKDFFGGSKITFIPLDFFSELIENDIALNAFQVLEQQIKSCDLNSQYVLYIYYSDESTSIQYATSVILDVISVNLEKQEEEILSGVLNKVNTLFQKGGEAAKVGLQMADYCNFTVIKNNQGEPLRAIDPRTNTEPFIDEALMAIFKEISTANPLSFCVSEAARRALKRTSGEIGLLSYNVTNYVDYLLKGAFDLSLGLPHLYKIPSKELLFGQDSFKFIPLSKLRKFAEEEGGEEAKKMLSDLIELSEEFDPSTEYILYLCYFNDSIALHSSITASAPMFDEKDVDEMAELVTRENLEKLNKLLKEGGENAKTAVEMALYAGYAVVKSPSGKPLYIVEKEDK